MNSPSNPDFDFDQLFFFNQPSTNFIDFPSLHGPFHRNDFLFPPTPYPRDKTALANSPPPDLKG